VVVAEAGGGTKPVAGAEVRLTFGSKSEVRRTGADGRFAFVELLAGKYTVKVTVPDGMKPKGEVSNTVTLAAGESERTDFVLISPEKPTSAPTPAPKSTPVPAASPTMKPVVGRNAVPSTSGLLPVLAPVSSPSPAVAQAHAQPQSRQQPQPSGGPASLSSSIGVALSPIALPIGTPGLLFAAASPTPPVGAPGTHPPADGTEVLAVGPPRRLITSFQALRDSGGGGSTTQLRTSVTDTSLVLGVPFRTQIDGTSFSLVNCGPASLAMVLTAFGLDVDPPSVRDYLNFLVGNYDTEAGTSLYILARIAQEAGLSTFGTNSGLQGWTIEAVREQLRAGHPVITLTKYRFLPGHFGSVTDFDHYIVLTGLAGDDFVYNDAAYSTEYGYNLLISPAQLQRAWAASSVPRHAVAVGFGDSLRPLPFVPSRLTAESLVSTEVEIDDVQAVVEPPVRVHRGPAAEWLREQAIDRLGARTTLVDGEKLGPVPQAAPRTRIDPSETAVQERPSGTVLAESYERPADVITDPVPGEAVADARDPLAGAGVDGSSARIVPAVGGQPDGAAAGFSAFGLVLAGTGLFLVLGSGLAGWRRRELRATILPALLPARLALRRISRQVRLPSPRQMIDRLPRLR
jgi:hypothetical protein